MPGKQYLIETDDEPVKRRPYDENKTFWPDSQNKAWGGPWPSNKSKKLGNKSQKVNVNQRGGYGADQGFLYYLKLWVAVNANYEQCSVDFTVQMFSEPENF